MENPKEGSYINPIFAISDISSRVAKGALKVSKLVSKEAANIKNTDIRYDDLGYLNFTGFVSKRRGNMNSFH